MAFRAAASGLCGLAAGGVWVVTYKPYAEAFWGGGKKEEVKEDAPAGPKAYHAVNPENSVCAMDISIDGRTVGRIEMELFDDTVPKTAKNFRVLCSGAYDEWAKDNPLANQSSGGLFGGIFGGGAAPTGVGYNLCPIHRIIPAFMLQAGDFTNGNGTGGRAIYGAKFADEHFKGKAGIHMKGALSMANSGPNTNGSQFFICFDEASWLNGKHVVFGQVLKGLDVVELVERQGSRSGAPRAECRIERALVLKKPSGSLEELANDEKYAAAQA